MATDVDRFCPRDPWAVLAPPLCGPRRPDRYRVTAGHAVATAGVIVALVALQAMLLWATATRRDVAGYLPPMRCAAYDPQARLCRDWSPPSTAGPIQHPAVEDVGE